MKIILLTFLLGLSAHAKILLLSKVVEKPGPGITRHEFGEGERRQAIFVENKAFITEKDIEVAILSQQQEGAVDVRLTEDGTEKMIAATSTMRPGIDRIAIILNGKVKSAPIVIVVPLGKNFVINGLDEKDEALKIAGLLSGKSKEEIEGYISKEKERIAALPEPPPPVYYTDEEYLELAAQREKIGLHYMDRIYTEKELDKLLTPGMILAEVTGIFGKANRVSRKDNGDWQMTFATAPEKFPLEEKFHMDSFKTEFSDGKLVSWRPFGSSQRTRTTKPPSSEPLPTNLIIKTPAADMSSEDFDFTSFIEEHEVSMKPGETEPTKADISQFLNILYSLSSSLEAEEGIDPECDIVSIVAIKIPEISKLSKEHKNGRIPFSDLNLATKPYVFGDRPTP